MTIENHSDIPTRYVRPYVNWVMARAADCDGCRHSRTRTAIPPRYANMPYIHWFPAARPEIKGFSFFTPYPGSPVAADDYAVRYRERKEPREKGARDRPEYLSVYFPHGKVPHYGGTAGYLEELFLRLYQITAHVCPALSFFGYESIQDTPLFRYRMRVVGEWSAKGRVLLNGWRNGCTTDAIEYQVAAQGGWKL